MNQPLQIGPGLPNVGRIELPAPNKHQQAQQAFGALMKKNGDLEIHVKNLTEQNRRLQEDLREMCAAFRTIERIAAEYDES